MKKMLIFGGLVVAIVIVVALLMRQPAQTTDETSAAPTGSTSQTAASPQVSNNANTGAVQAPNSLAILNQQPGPSVVVSAVTLSRPGFIVVRSSASSNKTEIPGTVIAHSKLLSSGTNLNITVPAATSPSGVYFAELRLDSGDKVFNNAEDLVAHDAFGNPIVIRFVASAPITSSPKAYTVTMKSLAFVPASLTVNQGDSVLFVNNDTTIHTVTATAFGGRNLVEIGKSFSLNTAKLAKGTYNFKCDFHSMMTGTLVVQ